MTILQQELHRYEHFMYTLLQENDTTNKYV